MILRKLIEYYKAFADKFFKIIEMHFKYENRRKYNVITWGSGFYNTKKKKQIVNKNKKAWKFLLDVWIRVM